MDLCKLSIVFWQQIQLKHAGNWRDKRACKFLRMGMGISHCQAWKQALVMVYNSREFVVCAKLFCIKHWCKPEILINLQELVAKESGMKRRLS